MSYFLLGLRDLPAGCRIYSVERRKHDTTVMVLRDADQLYFGLCVYDATSDESAQRQVEDLLETLREPGE